MSEEDYQEERQEVKINLAGLCTGFVLTIALFWSIWSGQSQFAKLTIVLLFVLGLGSHTVNKIYEK